MHRPARISAAVAATGFPLSPDDGRWPFYLAPGRYRLRVRGEDGAVLSVRPLEITDTSATQEMPGDPTRVPPPRPQRPTEPWSTRA